METIKHTHSTGWIVRRVLLGALIAAVLICAIISALPRPQNFQGDNPMRRDGDLPILIAHGGGNKEFPDNTLEAFYNAYSVDPRVMIETDVSITKDGVAILSHDVTLDRKTNVTGAIADWNYSDLMAQEVDFGYTNPTDDDRLLAGEREHFKDINGEEKYPTDVSYPAGVEPRHKTVFLATTLEELLTAFPDNRINLEIKQEGELGLRALREVLRLVEKYDAFDRVVLASFHSEIYAEFDRLHKSGEVPANFMYSPEYGSAARFYLLHKLGLDRFYEDGICVFQFPQWAWIFHPANRAFVDAAHAHNLAVHFWTVNDKEDMHDLIAIGVDGIMTDYPHRLGEVYASYEKPSDSQSD